MLARLDSARLARLRPSDYGEALNFLTKSKISRKFEEVSTLKKEKVIILLVCLLVPLILSVATAQEIPVNLIVIKSQLASKLAGEGISKSEIEKIFSDRRVVLYPELLEKLTKKPGEKKFSYFSLEFGMFTPRSILRGRNTLKENSKIFNEVERIFYVEKEALTSIFRIETNLGQILGKHRVFNSLLTFTAIKNRRSDWAEKELVNFILLCWRNGLDPLEINGSWAGAFGLCQFMPSSFLNFAVDGNNDGRIDLFSIHDAMASAANYLKKHGWQADNQDKQFRAIYAYNHNEEYAQAVLAYAKMIKKP